MKGGIAALAIGATTTATYYAVEHVRARQERSVETASASDRPNPSSPPVVAAPAASDAGFDAPEAGDAQDDAALEVSVAKPAPTTSTPVQEPKDSLDEEIAMLEDARSLLSSNPARAYEVLQRHAARFPRGKLGMERQLMMIEALQKQGRTTEARSLCESLLARSKGSLYEARLQRMLDNM